MDDLIFPSSDHVELPPIVDHKGKGRAYEPGQPLPSNAKARANSVDQLKSSSISPIADRKGKGRAYEPGQPLPSNTKAGMSTMRGRASSIDQPKSSSISTIADRKGKRKVYNAGQPQPSAAGVNDDCIAQPRSSAASESSPGPVAPLIYRNRKHALEHVSETEAEEEESSRSLKRLRRHQTSVQKVDMDVISLSSSDDGPSAQTTNTNNIDLSSGDDLLDFIVPDSSRPSSPPLAVMEIRQQVRDAIRYLMQDPTATEKNQAQMDAIVAVLTETRDVMIIMKTGGGKSILWMVPSVLDDEAKSIVVCPFVALLEEQYAKAAAAGLRCHNYSHSKDVPGNVQILFVQVEHCSSEVFARYECQSHLLQLLINP
jgi:hypothetical protein